MSGFDFPIRRIGAWENEPIRFGVNIEAGEGAATAKRRAKPILALTLNQIVEGETKMSKFIYLFRNNQTANQSMSPEKMQQHLKKWMDWRETLEKNGHATEFGQRLDQTGKVIKGRAKSVTDGPFVEVKDFVQGYLLVEAKDIDQAVELAKGCPIFENDGTVEIRPFLSM